MKVTLSNQKRGVLGLVGHAGCGHTNSFGGLLADDSTGLATILALWQEATDLCLEITKVEVVIGRSGYFTVETASGGKASAMAYRGITPSEARLAQYVIGKEAICTQTLAQEAFGRMNGQGAAEVAVALQIAIANAAINSFAINFPENFYVADENLEGNCGRIAGTVLDFDGIAVSTMGMVNATIGGIGPNEDCEGNIFGHGKKLVMAPLGLNELSTIISEGKLYSNGIEGPYNTPFFSVRASCDDNITVAKACLEAMQLIGFPAIYPKEALTRSPKAMTKLTEKMGDTIIKLGKKFKKAQTSREKVQLSAELNRFCSIDLGGVTFMSNALHEIVSGPDMMPKSSAVVTMHVPTSYINYEVFPSTTIADIKIYNDVYKTAIKILHTNLEKAQNELMSGIYKEDLDILSE